MTNLSRGKFLPVLVIGLSALPAILGVAAPATAQTASRTTVVDATGRPLGAVIGPNRVLVAFPGEGEFVYRLDANGFAEFPEEFPRDRFPGELLFEKPNCEGKSYATAKEAPQYGFFRPGTDAPAPGYTRAGQLFYIAPQSGVRIINSRQRQGEQCDNDYYYYEKISVREVKSVVVPSLKLPLSLTFPAATGKTDELAAYDSQGRYVGNVLDTGKIWRKFGAGEAVLDMTPTRIPPGTLAYRFETADCRGDAYLEAIGVPTQGSFVEYSTSSPGAPSGVIRYPMRPYKTTVVRGLLPVAGGQCVRVKPTAMLVGKAGIEGFKYKPPFEIK
jgi:hypothetical protein